MQMGADVVLDDFITAKDDLSGADIKVRVREEGRGQIEAAMCRRGLCFKQWGKVEISIWFSFHLYVSRGERTSELVMIHY